MTRALVAAPITIVSFVGALLLAAAAMRIGFVPDDTLRLWAGAITAGEGDTSIGHIVAGYPTVPFLSTTLVATLAPEGAPVPALVAAMVVAGMIACWFVSFRQVGLSIPAATAATVLIGCHPLFLRAVVGGPADAFLALFLFLTGGCLYDLRARSGTSEVMALGIVLLGLAFSHPMGAAVVFALTPFLVFALRPAIVTNSPMNVVVALVFPTLFGIGAFLYVSWVFPAAGWSFFAAPTQSLANWTTGIMGLFGDGLTGWLAVNAGLVIFAAIVSGAPVVVVTLGWIIHRRPLVVPPLVLSAALIVASATTVATGLFGDPASLAMAAPVMAALTIIRVPVARQRIHAVIALLLAGWIGGALALSLVDPAISHRVVGLFDGTDKERLDTLSAGGAASGRDGLLVDSRNAPAFVIGRGSARGIFDPTSEPFALALMFNRLDTPFVAVSDPQSTMGAGDRMNRAFPQLYRGGAADYREIYRNGTWRVFARNEAPKLREDQLRKAGQKLLSQKISER